LDLGGGRKGSSYRAREEERAHLADLLAPHPTPACCRRDLRGHVVDEVPPVLLNVESKVAFLISNDGRTSLPGAAVRSIA